VRFLCLLLLKRCFSIAAAAINYLKFSANQPVHKYSQCQPFLKGYCIDAVNNCHTPQLCLVDNIDGHRLIKPIDYMHKAEKYPQPCSANIEIAAKA
jgi:hypothetical protein